MLFALRTTLTFLLLYAFHRPFVVPFTQVIASVTYGILRAIDVHAWVSGASVGIPGFAVEIKNNCNAIYEIGLYASAVFAYPASLKQRALGSALGATLLYMVNLLRIS